MKNNLTDVVKSKLKHWCMFYFNKVYGVDNNKIVFVSFSGKTYSDNPKAISERLHEMDPTVDIVWIFDNPNRSSKIIPSYIRTVSSTKLEMLKELATAKVWVDNFVKQLYTFKSKEQYYIQTWHGDRGFKKALYDCAINKNEYKMLESEICDLAVSGSEHSKQTYHSAFRYNGEILVKGTPRNDCLVENDEAKSLGIKKNLGIDKETKILLYAPTLRGYAEGNNKLQQVNEIDLEEVISVLEEETDSEWICLVRAHVSVFGLSGIPKSNKFLDATTYEDMADLLLASDLYITDYSSSAGDFVLRNKPVILFQNDRELYVEKDRAFYFDIDSSPYIVAMTQKELISKIRSLKNIDIPQNCKDILEFYGTNETGDASGEVSRIILTNMGKVND